MECSACGALRGPQVMRLVPTFTTRKAGKAQIPYLAKDPKPLCPRCWEEWLESLGA